jgi:hypothetical protein
MSTLGSPIPTRPESFTVDGVPPGVRWNPLSIARPTMDHRARSILYHTNAAGSKSSLATQRRFADGSNTTPTYEVGLDPADGAEKWLRSDQRHVANGTVTESTVVNGVRVWDTLTDEQRASIREHGRAAEFSLAIESLDLGFLHGIGGATDFQGEIVARIFAYEAIVNDFPVARPANWFSPGCSYHTAPEGNFPFWTIHRGKTCPGAQKIADFNDWILPRAVEIWRAWTGTPPADPSVPFPGKVRHMFRACKLGDDLEHATWWYGDGTTSWHWPSSVPDETEQALILAEGLVDVRTRRVVHRWSDVGLIQLVRRRNRYVGRPAQ